MRSFFPLEYEAVLQADALLLAPRLQGFFLRSPPMCFFFVSNQNFLIALKHVCAARGIGLAGFRGGLGSGGLEPHIGRDHGYRGRPDPRQLHAFGRWGDMVCS